MKRLWRTGLVALTVACWLVPSIEAAKKKEAPEAPETKLAAETFAGLELRGIGPALMSGRIADVVIDPTDASVWYVAVGSGGVWKTVNAGTTWESIFDGEPSYSIGCVTLDPNDPQTVWVGTGENVGGRHVGFGDGVYRSRDGGKSWQQMGLADSEHIGNIVVDPRDSDVVFVAAQGPLWSGGGERGLYKTTDGGQSWTKILGGGEFTGVNEVHMDPRHADLLYATTHQRVRTVAALVNGGPESGIHKSTDGGTTWRRLDNGLPKEDMGKIGLAISPIDPDVVYATVELAFRKIVFYRSADRGETWEKMSERVSDSTGPHYYQEIFASPHKLDRVYEMDNRLRVTEDGGRTLEPVGEENKHGDNHALAFDSNDPNYLLAGSDGGLYESFDLGRTWKFVANLPVTQFYKVAIDYDEPFYNLVGGTQDNSTQHGPSRTDDQYGIRNADWMITVFADGHQPAIDPTNPDIIYSEWQQGNQVRHDRKTGEVVYIQPQPKPEDPPERWNWDSPILISPHDPARLYVASQRVWRSDDRGDSWRPISGDLTRGEDRLLLPMMDRVWSDNALWDLYAMSNFNTVTSISESPLEDGLFYAGTDDGLVQVSEDGGATWRRIEALPGVPDRAFVNDIKADLHDADTVYVALDNHKEGDFAPYLLKSTDRGRTWRSIAGDLPDRHLVWRLVQDHVNPDLLFLGTEFGIFFTVDGGGHWVELTGNMPNISFRDLAIQKRENDLVGASFGRGFWILDDYTPLRQVSEAMLAEPASLFPVRRAWWYVERRTLGSGGKASQGDAYFLAPNPPFGAVFTYYLSDDLETDLEERREREKEIAAEGGDTPYPGWKVMKEESLEEEPAVLLTVKDADGNIVRRLTGPAEAGFHRVAWDLRYPSTRVNTGGWRSRGDSGVLAAPGTYRVTMATRHDGVVTEIGEQSFEVVPLWDGGTLPGSEPSRVAAFLAEVAETTRLVAAADAVLAETGGRLEAIAQALARSTTDAYDAEVAEMRRRAYELRDRLSGDQQRAKMGEEVDRTIQRYLDVAATGNSYSTYGPTPTHVESLAAASELLVELRRDLAQLVDVDLPALEEKLEEAGVVWTPGRKVP